MPQNKLVAESGFELRSGWLQNPDLKTIALSCHPVWVLFSSFGHYIGKGLLTAEVQSTMSICHKKQICIFLLPLDASTVS